MHLHRTGIRLIHFESLVVNVEPMCVSTDDDFLRGAYMTYLACRAAVTNSDVDTSLETEERVAVRIFQSNLNDA